MSGSAADVPRLGGGSDQPLGTLLAALPVRLGIVLPVFAAVLHGAITGRIVDPVLFWLLAAGGIVVVGPAAVGPVGQTATVRFERGWQVLSGTVGVALAQPFFTVAVDVEVERYTLLFAVVLVAGAYSFPPVLRWPLSSWTLVVWGATLWGGGVRAPETLLLHLGGGLLILVASVRTSNALLGSVELERQTRADAERRTRLLASVLRTNSLEPGDVIEAVVSGLVDVGFDAVSIREVASTGDVLRYVAGHGFSEEEAVVDLPIDEGLSGRAARQGRPVLVDDYARAVGILPGSDYAGAIAVPVGDEAGTVAVLLAARRTGSLTDLQRESAVLLAEQAGAALRRAVEFETDRRTVEQLRDLEGRTQDFVSTVSHELRTPLTVIQGLGQTLARRWDDLDGPRRSDLLRRIDANAERLGVMVRSLLDTSALEQGRLDLHVLEVRLLPAVVALLHRLATVTAAHPIELDIDDAVTVEVDPSLFEHVLENLLTNVAKHTPQGTRVMISAVGRGDEVRIEVADNGPGIAEEDLPFVLDRFYRGGEPTRRPAGGLGLGLALARQIVQAHGSELEVQRNDDGGTSFVFSVPRAARPGARDGRDGTD